MNTDADLVFQAFYACVYGVCTPTDRGRLDSMRRVLVDLDPQVVTECPCCSQRVHLYKRNMTVAMARSLVTLLRYTYTAPQGANVQTDAAGKVYFYWRQVASDTGQGGASLALLRHFGLVVPFERRTAESNSRGFWAISAEGEQFVRRAVRLPRSAYIYNNACFGWSYDTVSIAEVVEHFSYEDEVLGGAP